MEELDTVIFKLERDLALKRLKLESLKQEIEILNKVIETQKSDLKWLKSQRKR